MSNNFVKVGLPVNGRQNFYCIDEKNRKKYTYSIPEENFDKFEQYDQELSKRLEALREINRDELVSNLQKQHIQAKARIIGAATGVVSAAIPLAACLKYISGAKRFVIGGISAAALGLAGMLTGYIASIGMMVEKAGFKTQQGQELKEFLSQKTDFDLKLENSEPI